MRPTRLALVSALDFLQACVNTQAVRAPVRAGLNTTVARVGSVTLEARLAINGQRRLQAAVNPYAAGDIDHVRLELFQGVTSKGTLVVSQAQISSVVKINNLQPNTSYTVVARAWQDAGETVVIDNYAQDAASCTTSFATTNDNVLSLAGGIALRLRDRTFSGLGSGAIAITAGGLVPAGVENLALYANAGIVTTLAGSTAGYVDATGGAAQFGNPWGAAVDGAGNVYVADESNHRIRKVSPAGVVTTLAGSTAGYAEGTGTAAQFNSPYGVAVDGAGNVYVADANNARIRKVSPAGVVTTLAGSTYGNADGTGTAAQFMRPYGIAVDGTGNVYLADVSAHRIRKVSSAGVVTTLAGSTRGTADGTGAAAQFDEPNSLTVDGAGNVYVCDVSHRIRKVSPAGVVTTLAGSTMGYGDGTGPSAQFSFPFGIAVDAAGNLYVADSWNHRVRKVSPAGVVTTLAGSGMGYADGTGAAAALNYPRGMAIGSAGELYVTDTGNYRVRKVQ